MGFFLEKVSVRSHDCSRIHYADMVGLKLTDIQLPQSLKDWTKNDVTPQLPDEQTLGDHTVHTIAIPLYSVLMENTSSPVILSSDSGRLMKGDMFWSEFIVSRVNYRN